MTSITDNHFHGARFWLSWLLGVSVGIGRLWMHVATSALSLQHLSGFDHLEQQLFDVVPRHAGRLRDLGGRHRLIGLLKSTQDRSPLARAPDLCRLAQDPPAT